MTASLTRLPYVSICGHPAIVALHDVSCRPVACVSRVRSERWSPRPPLDSVAAQLPSLLVLPGDEHPSEQPAHRTRTDTVSGRLPRLRPASPCHSRPGANRWNVRRHAAPGSVPTSSHQELIELMLNK